MLLPGLSSVGDVFVSSFSSYRRRSAMNRYLIIVSRERLDLLATLAITYGRKGEAEIRVDRRRGRPWTGPGDRPRRRARSRRDWDLYERGFLVIPRSASSSRRAALAESADNRFRGVCVTGGTEHGKHGICTSRDRSRLGHGRQGHLSHRGTMHNLPTTGTPGGEPHTAPRVAP